MSWRWYRSGPAVELGAPAARGSRPRRGGSFFLALALAAGLAGSAAAQRAQRGPALGRPNLLLIVLDDVGTDALASFDTLSAPPYAPTPRLDALAERGIRFTRFYANTVCSATRALMQTGRYALRTGMGTNTEVWQLPDSEVLLAELLRHGFAPGEGYACGAFGKWHLGDDDPAHAVRNGYQRFYGTLHNTGDHFTWSKIEHDAGGLPSAPIPQTTWSASVVRRDALRWIRAQQQPFFAWVAFNPPHREWQVPPKALLSAETQAELAAFAEGQVAVGASERRQFYRATLEAVDTEIGRLLDGLDPLVLANTMVIVASDNGGPAAVINPPHDSSHAKPTAYELGIRVPMIVAGPLVPPAPPGGHVCDELVGAVDLWRTLGAIAGADEDLAFQHEGFLPPYPEIDSTSFLPLILDPAAPGPNAWTFAQFFDPAGVYATSQCLRIHLRAMTDGTYKYIRLVDKGMSGPCAPFVYTEELYHLPSDPEEAADLLLLGPLSGPAQAAIDNLRAQMDFLSEY